MRDPERRLAVLVALAGMLAAVALATPSLPVVVRAAGALALAFALPGTAIACATMPAARFRRSERLAMALGGSMAATVGTAFALNVLPGGLSASSWAVFLGLVTVTGGLIGAIRLSARPRPEAAPAASAARPPDRSSTTGPWVAGPPSEVGREWLVAPSAAAMLAAAGVLVVLAFVLARGGLELGPRTAFTELWLLPVEGGSAVRLGIGNHEGDAMAYRVVVTVDGQRLGEPRRVALPDGGSSSTLIALPAPSSGDAGARSVEARLWTEDQAPGAEPARRVRATITAGPTIGGRSSAASQGPGAP